MFADSTPMIDCEHITVPLGHKSFQVLLEKEKNQSSFLVASSSVRAPPNIYKPLFVAASEKKFSLAGALT